jgi:phosphoglycerate dehydrogenase-like enzyme
MGSRWLIVGYGAIGEAVAQRAKGFGAHVTGVRRSAPASFIADAMATPAQLPQLLPESDVVVLTMPKTAETENTVDAKFFAAMKPGSVLVNVGRGAVVDDDALRAALDSGKPERAILDVFRQEPLPADSWFWDHPRVTMTPHNSAASSGIVARGDALFIDNLNRYLAGQPMRNEVKY